MRYEICAITDVGGIRQNNEDGFCINHIGCFNVSEGCFYGKFDVPILTFVADGVGGSRAGEEATRVSIQVAQNEEIPKNDGELISLIDKMNKGVVAIKRTIDCSCTLAGIALDEDDGYAYNLGDSRIYTLEQGYLNQISIDDTASGLSGEDCGDIEHGKEPLVQYLGKEMVLPHIEKIQCDKQFMICTDGLTDMLSLDDIESIFCEGTNIKVIASRLMVEAKNRGGIDNITLIIVKPLKEDNNG